MNLTPILPEIILFLGALLVLMSDVFLAKKSKNFAYVSHLLSLIICSVSGGIAARNLTLDGLFFSEMLRSNSYIAFVKVIAIVSLIFVVMLSIRFVILTRKFGAEFLSLMMIATAGGLIMISANDFLVFYLGLELQALSSYLLASFNSRLRFNCNLSPNSYVQHQDSFPQALLYNSTSWQTDDSQVRNHELSGYSKDSGKSSEAGMKYFILGSLASGLLLFGISLIYGYSSTTNFSAIGAIFAKAKPVELPVAMIFGLVLVLIAMFFKISAAPFHMWTPDVYQGSPTSTASFFATTGKLTAVAALINLLMTIGWNGFSQLISLIALLSIAVGSFGAIFQKNIKRLLAYSSVSHIGFMLLAIAVFDKQAIVACILYLAVYVVISLGMFGLLTMLHSSSGKDSDAEDDKVFAISSLAGLSKTNPIIAFAVSIFMFSTAGIPPLAGFFSKFYVLANAISGRLMAFAIVAVVFSVISSFYYLRIVKIIYFDKPTGRVEIEDFGNVRIIIIIAAAFNLFFIIFLKNFISAIESFVNF